MNREGRNHDRAENYWQWAKHARLYSDLLQALKGKQLGSSTEETLISASAVPTVGGRVGWRGERGGGWGGSSKQKVAVFRYPQ